MQRRGQGTTSTRTRRTVAVLAATGLLAAVPLASASASGDIVPNEGNLDVSVQHIAMSLVDGQQHMLISYDLTGESERAALVIATPTPATLVEGEAGVLEAFESVSQPPAIIEERWWPDLDFLSGGGAAVEDPADAAVVGEGLDIVPLPHWGGADIGAWILNEGFPVSGELQTTLNSYADQGWYVTVIKLDGQNGSVSGMLPPIDLTFATESLVLPMMLASTSSTTLELRTYVVGGTRLDRADPDRASAAVAYAGVLSADENPELAAWIAPFGGAAYLTRTDQVITNPTRLTSDFTFAESTLPGFVAAPAVVTVDRIIWGMPAGPVLVGGGMLLVAIAGVVISRFLSRRHGY